MELPKHVDFLVIGGGVMGASIAYHLALKGQGSVLLLEKDPFFGQGATGRCAGGVRYQFGTEVNVQLSIKSLPMLENFKAETGQAVDYIKCGYLFILSKDEDVKTFRHNVEMQNRLGAGTQWLDGDEVRRRLPLLRLDDIQAGTFNERDGIVDPNGVVMGYIQGAQRLGAKCLGGVEVHSIQVQNGRAAGVETNLGPIAAGVIINAAGPWAGIVGQMADVDIPIIPLRRQWLTTTPLPELPPDFPFVIDFGQSLYFHRESAGLLTGMSNPDEKPGIEQSIDPDWELVHLEAALERFPLLEKAGVVSRCAGLYEVTPDAHPIFGKTPVEGFYVCAGYSGHGFMHGPIAGVLMTEIILEGQAKTVDVSMLDLARFEEGRLITEYNVV